MPNSYNIFNTYEFSGILPVTMGLNDGPIGNTYWNTSLYANSVTLGPTRVGLSPPRYEEGTFPGVSTGTPPNSYENEPLPGVGTGTAPDSYENTKFPGTGKDSPPNSDENTEFPDTGTGTPPNSYENETFPDTGTGTPPDSYENQPLPGVGTGTPPDSYENEPLPGVGTGTPPNSYENEPLPGVGTGTPPNWYEDEPLPGVGTGTPPNWYEDEPLPGVGTGTFAANSHGVPAGTNTYYWPGNEYTTPNEQIGVDPSINGLKPGAILKTYAEGEGYTLGKLESIRTDKNITSLLKNALSERIPISNTIGVTQLSANRNDIVSLNTNQMGEKKLRENLAKQAGSALIGALPVAVDIPAIEPTNPYFTLPFSGLFKPIGPKYQDFRARLRGGGIPFNANGTSASTRLGTGFNPTAVKYAAENLTPWGVYPTFNLETYYGFGNQGSTVKSIQHSDFTARSQVATVTDGKTGKSVIKTTNPIERATEFRGDKVNVIDFGKRSKQQIYQWMPTNNITAGITSILGAAAEHLPGLTGVTNDFIKFYFTGPKMNAHGGEDDVLVFRAILTNLHDSFAANWKEHKMIGRADPNFTYGGFGRDLSVDFTVYATDRDEMKPMYRKLNYLASYLAPEYSDHSIAMVAPWLRITIGDLFVHQPAIITSMYYTFVDTDTSWETNITNDVFKMQAPFKVDVNIQFHLITDYLPQKGGRMYTLAKEFDSEGQPLRNSKSDWLPDAIPTTKEIDLTASPATQEETEENMKKTFENYPLLKTILPQVKL